MSSGHVERKFRQERFFTSSTSSSKEEGRRKKEEVKKEEVRKESKRRLKITIRYKSNNQHIKERKLQDL